MRRVAMVQRTRVRSGQRRSEEWFAAASLGSSADAYVRYLTERGYAAESIKGYFRSVAHFVHWLTQRRFRARDICDFLTDRFGAGTLSVSAHAPADVADFMTRYTAARAPGSVKATGISLRSYFMLKASRREPTKVLIAALPRVAQWRLSRLPQYLSAAEIERLLSAFDRTSATR